ncbi:MFS transporter [Longispora sp. NPDC051575]|uniref:MFS transporter n=1 Tax=Longispora sp. NPDC051575 TaxID=3154943 RepID=UPI00342CE51B
MRTRTSARLGADFTRLWTASAVSNLGDGVTMVAGPLLVASLTDDPALVAGAAFVQQLPWLLFSLISGAYVDRLDRRRLIVSVNLLRALALGGLAAAVATGTVGVAVVYAVFFLAGVGETLADTASGALLPAIVPAEKLDTANARLMAAFTVGNQFVAKPLGAWLFVVGAALPFGVDAVTFLVAAALMAAVRPARARTGAVPVGSAPVQPVGSTQTVEPAQAVGSAQAVEPPRPVGADLGGGSDPEVGPVPGLRAEIAEGVRWLWHHPLLRALALGMGLANVAFCAAFATFVLYARDRLGLSEVGFGVLLTAFAVGGLLGTVLTGRLRARFGATALLRAGLVVELLTHVTLAVTRTPWVAATVIVLFGVHSMVWGVIVVTLRQRVVPDGLLGRVGSVYSLLDLGGACLGSLLGGVLAHGLGVTAPFWIAAAVMAVITTVLWHPLRRASTG